MDIRRFTFWMGVVFLIIGVLGFVPALVDPPLVYDPTLGVAYFHGRLFGLFPVNVVHNLIHIAFGVWGLVAAKEFITARAFCRANAIVYIILAVLGLFPVLNTVFGLVPLHSHDVWLHALIAVATGYYGYVWVNQYNRGKTDTKATVR